MIVVAAAAIGLILFVAFIVSRLLRTRTRGMSIRMQVFLALAVIIGTFAFGLGLMVIDRIEARAVRLATQAASEEAAALSGMLEGELDRSGMTLAEVAERLEQEATRGADLRLELLDRSGQVVFPAQRDSAAGKAGTVAVQSPIEVGGRLLGSVRVVKPTVVMRRMLADFAPTVMVISLVLGAAAALAAAWIGRAIARPIESLTGFAERVSAGERTAPPPAVFGREVTGLAGSIDSMRRQLEGRPFVEAFAADLSHELKNPVAAIRASAEVLEEGALEEPDEARHFVTRILESSQRIERLLNDLLSLARIEAHGVENLTPVDLGELARSTLKPLHEERERVAIRSEGGVRVHGDATWIGRAIGNLIDNALVHGSNDEPVQVRVQREGQQAVFSVRNRGSIQEHVRRRLFRRFVTTRSDKGGSGLGLAIVRAVAEAHGGQVQLVKEGPPEVHISLRLPLAWRPAGPPPSKSGGSAGAA
jgi:signal transduction histidine kinase